MVRACVGGDKEGFADRAMKAFMVAKSGRDKHRQTDLKAGSHSPLKTKTNPPVGKMFYEGAWRLLTHAIHVPVLHESGSSKIALEAYPGLLARQDSSGDVLDALLCAVQAAWASRQENFGLPADVVPCEGWIVSA